MEKSNAVIVKEYFGMTTAEMKSEWLALSAEERETLANGIRDESLDY